MQPVFLTQLNEDVQNVNNNTNSGGWGIWGENVRPLNMSIRNDQAPLFKILPAHDYEMASDSPDGYKAIPGSLVQFKDSVGNLTGWIRLIYMARYCGHGKGQEGNRTDLVSLRTFATGDADVQCPIEMLRRYCAEHPEWKYLVDDVVDTAGNRLEGSPLAKVACFGIANVIDLNHPEDGPKIGLFGTSPRKSLIGADGLVNQLNPACTQAQLDVNPMAKWVCGDLTDPANGPVLTLTKEVTNKSKYSSYKVQFAQSGGLAMRFPVTKEMLDGRKDLFLDLKDNILKPVTFESIVQDMVKVYNRVSPCGVHEYEVLRAVFGNMVAIPDAPVGSSANTPAFGGNAQQVTVPPVSSPVVDMPAPTASTVPMASTVPTAAPAASPQGLQQPAATQSLPADVPATLPGVPSTPAGVPGMPQTDGGTFDREQFMAQLNGAQASK